MRHERWEEHGASRAACLQKVQFHGESDLIVFLSV